MMEGGDERDRWGVGNGGEGGHGCSHDSLTPSFTVSQRIKCQTNQLSSKQTSTGTGHDGIYLPRVHINNIKKDIVRNRLSSNNVPTHTIKPLAITIICSLALYSVSPQPLGSLCCNSSLVPDWWTTDKVCRVSGKPRSSNLWSLWQQVQLQLWPATHKHPSIHTDLIWHWVITEFDPSDLFRPIKLLICMLTTEAHPGRPLPGLWYLPQRCDTGTMGRALPEYQSLHPPCSLPLFAQEDGVQRSLSSQEVKPSICLTQTRTYTCLKGKKTTRD